LGITDTELNDMASAAMPPLQLAAASMLLGIGPTEILLMLAEGASELICGRPPLAPAAIWVSGSSQSFVM
jgi:hypothetical protein